MFHINDIVVVDNSNNKDTARLWCPVCNFILRSADDIISSRENGCCEECWLAFGQSRKKDWNNGWRPDAKILNRYKQERSLINTSIEDIIGENK